MGKFCALRPTKCDERKCCLKGYTPKKDNGSDKSKHKT